MQPKFRHKVVLINGDTTLPRLGISSDDRDMIVEKVRRSFGSVNILNFEIILSFEIRFLKT